MEKVLTIAIPTYNRYETLKESLKSIANQWNEQMSEKVEVIISDNASTDLTNTIVENESFNQVNAKYYRNIENVGPDINFFNCWNKAKGKYVLLLSDDDVIFLGTIKAIIPLLEKNPDILYLSVGDWTNRNMNCRDCEEKIIEYNTDEGFLKKLGLTITVLSSLVLKKEYINTQELKKYVGTFFTQVYAVLGIMKKCDKYYIIRENPSIGNRPGNQRFYNLYDQWLVYYQDALMSFTELGISKKFCRMLFADSIKDHIRHWLLTFSKTTTMLDVRITWKSIIRTMSYPESWRYLYHRMVILQLTTRLRNVFKRGKK